MCANSSRWQREQERDESITSNEMRSKSSGIIAAHVVATVMDNLHSFREIVNATISHSNH